MRIPKKYRPKVAKDNQYKIKNWREYNQALRQRGSLEIWIEKDIEGKWYYDGPKQRGAQYEYSDVCIEMAATLREVYHLPYRQLQGFIESLVGRLGWSVKVPDYTVIQKRIKKLNIVITDGVKRSGEKKYIVLDSTGLKVYGEGEWKVRLYGWEKNRTWMKFHIAVDEATAIIESAILTDNGVGDAKTLKPLLEVVEGKIYKVAADGAYDKYHVYATLKELKIKPLIPPHRRSRIKRHGNKRGRPLARDKSIREIRRIGRKRWKEKVNYHRRSIVENTMFRFKTIFGGKLRSRTPEMSKVEAKIKCKLLNKMTDLGMPVTYVAKAA